MAHEAVTACTHDPIAELRTARVCVSRGAYMLADGRRTGGSVRNRNLARTVKSE